MGHNFVFIMALRHCSYLCQKYALCVGSSEWFVMASVIWVGEPESLFDVLLYENLHVFP